VATVNNAGLVTAVAEGTAIITVTTEDEGKTAACTVTVSLTPVAVTGVSLDKTTLALAVGGTETLTAAITPANATNQNVTWLSDNESVATVSNAGLVTGVAAGTANITVTTGDGSFTVDCVVTVVGYTEMLLATSTTVTITGDSAYEYDSSTKGVFISGRTVTLSPFYIAKYETTYELWYTVKQWAAGNGYSFANPGCEGDDGTDGDPPTGTAKYEPVTGISWRDAVVWCNAYSEMSGKGPVYYTDSTYSTVLRISTNDSGTSTAADTAVMKAAANGYRLPTEAEWEYAARGGGTPSLTTPFTDKWAGTDTESDLVNYAWYDTNSVTATHPVGEKTVNGLGLYDMSGNVWEWCWDRHGAIDPGSESNPVGPGSGTLRVIRGGGLFTMDASGCAVAYRSSHLPHNSFSDVGFRVVCP
jgi:formylglycine-generating enzyme required for sulfatase activity